MIKIMMVICVLSMMMMIFDDDDDLSNLLCISVILISDVKLKNISSMAHLTIISYVRPMIISPLITFSHYVEVIVVEYMLL